MKASIRGLEVFRAVMHTGSISKSAMALNVSQPTASGIIRRLEEAIGMPLFERTASGLTPTPEALRLLPEIDRIFNHIDYLQTKVEGILDGESSFLSVQCLPSMSKYFVSPTISAFKSLNDKVSIYIHSGPSTQVISNVEVGAFDVGFVYGVREGSTILEYVPLKTMRFACIMHRDNPLKSHDVIDVEKLAGENLILNRSGTLLRRAVDTACQEHGVELTPGIETGTIQAYDLISNGAGIGILDSSLLSKDYYPQLISRPCSLNIETKSYLIYCKKSPLSIFAKQYIDIVRLFFSGDTGLKVRGLSPGQRRKLDRIITLVGRNRVDLPASPVS